MTPSRPHPPRIYAIADPDCLERPLGESVRLMASAGIEWIQLRVKRTTDRSLLGLAREAKAAISGLGARLWLNDRPDLAALLTGERIVGVHLGQGDLSAAAARPTVGKRLWIGVSTHDEGQVREAAADPEVDLIAVGPVFSTGSKPDACPSVGLDLVRKARSATDKPLVAIGGIGLENLTSVLEAGADSVAVLSAICVGDVGQNASLLLTAATKAGVAL